MTHEIEKTAEGKWYPANNEELWELIKDADVNLGNIDTSRITDMSDLFTDENGKECRTDYSGIETWDVSKVKTMGRMFKNAVSFNHDISGWDVSNVEYMNSMFRGATSFNQPLDKWDVSNVKNMGHMFHDAKSFNQPIGEWDVSMNKSMHCMFQNASSFNQPIGKWNVSKVQSREGIFDGAESFKQDISEWNKKKIIIIDEIEKTAEGKWYPANWEELRLLCDNESIKLGDIDTSRIKYMNYLFSNSERKDFSGIETWDVSNVRDMSGMFQYVCIFNQDISGWDVSNVRNMSRMFFNAISFNQPIGKWDVSKVKDMWNMFKGSSFNQDISRWDVSDIELYGIANTMTLGDKIIVCDPFMIRRGNIVIENVLPGTYMYYFVNYDRRCRSLRIYHHDLLKRNTYNKMYDVGNIGVDSAMAGIFDYESIPSVDEYDNFTNECFEAKRYELGGRVLNGKGVVSQSGYGDGDYNVKVFEYDGKVEGVIIDFIKD